MADMLKFQRQHKQWLTHYKQTIIRIWFDTRKFSKLWGQLISLTNTVNEEKGVIKTSKETLHEVTTKDFNRNFKGPYVC